MGKPSVLQGRRGPSRYLAILPHLSRYFHGKNSLENEFSGLRLVRHRVKTRMDIRPNGLKQVLKQRVYKPRLVSGTSE